MENVAPKKRSKFFNFISHLIGFEYYGKKFYDKHMRKLENKGLIIDARSGGLVIGRPHCDGGVYFLYPTFSGYGLAGEVEGYEYIINRKSTKYFQHEITKQMPFVKNTSYQKTK